MSIKLKMVFSFVVVKSDGLAKREQRQIDKQFGASKVNVLTGTAAVTYLVMQVVYHLVKIMFGS